MDQSIRASKIFLAVFAIALCGLGVAVLLPALRNLRQGGPLAARMFTATVFGIVGLGLVAVILFASKRARLSDSLRREHPEQPWLWREDWSHGRSNSKTKSSMISA